PGPAAAEGLALMKAVMATTAVASSVFSMSSIPVQPLPPACMQAVLCGVHPLEQRLAGVFCSALKRMPTILANCRFFPFRHH
ncbi:MAG: hypothetical protein K0M60_11550, partial [Hydrogenophaga sp.]|nr:hypothetical protein [Hydrogenophaga sp.]